MPEKAKKQKPKAPPKPKVVRFTPKINLLKNLNAIMLIAGFSLSLITVYVITSQANNYDVRSRGQELMTPTPTITLTPSPLCPTDTCISPSPEK